MKKLAFLSVFLLGGFAFNNVWAACAITNDTCDTDDEYLIIPGHAGCYTCETGKCISGNVVSATTANLEGKPYVNKMFTCQLGGSFGNDRWIVSSNIPKCRQRQYRELENDENAHRELINPATGRPSTTGGATSVVGTEACIAYFCNSSFTQRNGNCVKPNTNCGGAFLGDVRNNSTCNPSSPSTGLSDTAHVKSGNVCTLTCVAGGWDVKLNNNACASGYLPDSSRKKCVESDASRQRRHDNANKKSKCESSGGIWVSNKCSCDASKNLKKSGDECVCLNNTDYKRSADGKSCELTNAAVVKKSCEAAAASGAIWDGTKCTCSDAKKIWNGSTCIANPNIANCEAIDGAKWSNGECVCKDADKEMNEDGTECVESEAARKRREEAIAQREQEAARTRITSISSNLSGLKAGLKTSVWKNKEGNFNTSRLVSDSVAGVVLGTAGGLITSNVIKKNQIKGGFEDIKCTIRGQVVADYADEFQVGIQ